MKYEYFMIVLFLFKLIKFSRLESSIFFVQGRLLQDIVLEMELRMNSNKSENTLRKMHLYSGHDVGVGLIMGFMKTFIKQIDFGASVHFHLHVNKENRYTVKVMIT